MMQRQEWKDSDREWLKTLLKENEVTVTFTKTDGSERVMTCTLQNDSTDVYEKKTDRVKKANDEVLAVVDVSKNEWRSFRFDSIKSVEWSV